MTNPNHFCVLCPDRERIPYRPPVCEGCRSWLEWMIGDIRDYARQLADGPDLVPDLRVAPVPIYDKDDDGKIIRDNRIRIERTIRDGDVVYDGDIVYNVERAQRAAWRDKDDNLVLRRRDPINAALPSGSPGNPSGIGKVSGSPESRLPIHEDAVDIMAPARRHMDHSVPAMLVQATVTDPVTVNHRYVQMVDGEPQYMCVEVTGTRKLRLYDRDGWPLWVDPHDQIGQLPLVTSLDGWAASWCKQRGRDEWLPDPTIAELCGWLRKRLEWACDEFDGIADFAEEMRRYRAAMAAVLGLVDVPEHKAGVRCPKCRSMTLFRRHGGVRDGSLWVECSTCPAMLSPGEYTEWTKRRAEAVRDGTETTDDDLGNTQVVSSMASPITAC